MQPRFRRFHSVLIALAVTACAAESGLPQRFDARGDMTFDAFVEDATWVDERELWVVDGDTPVQDLEELRAIYDRIGRRDRAWGPEGTSSDALSVMRSGGRDHVWSADVARSLTFCVSTSFGSRYDQVVDAMLRAGAAWSAVARVRFIHLSEHDRACTRSNGAVVFDVRPTRMNDFLALAFFPGFPRSQRTVLIADSAFVPGVLGDVDLVGILRHELGHVLGFRHEHTRPEAGACFEDTAHRPLTPYDRASVMHYPQCNGRSDTRLEITRLDAEGARLIYGAPISESPAPPPPSDEPPTTSPDDPPPTVPPDESPGDAPPTSDPPSSGGCLVAEGSVPRGLSNVYPPVRATGDIEVRLTGSGDADLYVWLPDTFQVCISDGPTAEERCRLRLSDSTLWVEVHGYDAARYRLELCPL